jgi:hypothetical protein
MGNVYRHAFYLNEDSIGRQMLLLVHELKISPNLYNDPFTSYLMAAVAVSNILPDV